MAASATELKVVITGDAKGLEAATQRAGAALTQTRSASNAAGQGLHQVQAAGVQSAGALSELAAAAKLYVGGMAAVALAQQAVAAYDGFKGLQARLTDVTGSAQEGAAALASVYAIAQRQATDVEAVGSAYARVGASVRKMGGDSRDTGKIVEAVSASLRLNRATAAEASSTMLQFGQAMGKGRVNGDEFMSLMENAPTLMDAVTRALGKTQGEMYAMSESGQLTSAVMAGAVRSAFTELTQRAQALPLSFEEAQTRTSNALKKAAADSQAVAGVSAVAVAALKLVATQAGPVVDGLTLGIGALAVAAGGRLVAGLAASVTASLAARAARLAELQATAAATAATLAKAEADLVAARTAAVLSPAVAGVAAAQTAQAAAARAAAVAQGELALAQSGVRSALVGVLGVFGGPAGLIASLALGAAGWVAYNQASKADGTDDLIAKLEAQNKALRDNTQEAQTNALATAQAALAKAQSIKINTSDAGGNTVELIDEEAVARAQERVNRLQGAMAESARLMAKTTASVGDSALKDAPKSLEQLRQTLKTRTQVLSDYAKEVADINAAANAALGQASAGGRGAGSDTQAKIETDRSELLKKALADRNSALAALNSAGAQQAAASAELRRAQLENASAAELAALDRQLSGLAQRYQLGQVQLADYVQESTRLERSKLSAKEALLAQELAQDERRKGKDTAEQTQIAAKAEAVRGKLAAVRAELAALDGATPKALVDALAKLRNDSEALAGFDIADPIKRSEAVFQKRVDDAQRLADTYAKLAAPAPAPETAPGKPATAADVANFDRRQPDAIRQAEASRQAEQVLADWRRRATAEHVQGAVDAAREIALANKESAAALLTDDRARASAQVALEKEAMLRRLEPLKALPDQYAQALDAVDEAVQLKMEVINRSLTPQWKQNLNSWADTVKTMGKAWDDLAEKVQSSGEEAFAQIAVKGKADWKSLGDAILADTARWMYRMSLGKLFGPAADKGGGAATGGSATSAAGNLVAQAGGSVAGKALNGGATGATAAADTRAAAASDQLASSATTAATQMTSVSNAAADQAQATGVVNVGMQVLGGTQEAGALTQSNAMGLTATAAQMATNALIDLAIAARLASSAQAGKGGSLPALAEANGDAFTRAGVVHAFAAGGTFSASASAAAADVVSQPTRFAYREGGRVRPGLLGEAGPEAIMPLERTATGLAVRLIGADGRVRSAPLTRDSAGRLAARDPGGNAGPGRNRFVEGAGNAPVGAGSVARFALGGAFGGSGGDNFASGSASAALTGWGGSEGGGFSAGAAPTVVLQNTYHFSGTGSSKADMADIQRMLDARDARLRQQLQAQLLGDLARPGTAAYRAARR